MENAKVELRAEGLHWIKGLDPQEDCCVHGRIFLRIGEHVVSDGNDDWTVSTAAYNFLRTIFHDHEPGINKALIPCCGSTMLPAGSADDGLYIPNCGNGIDWSVTHFDNVLEHTLPHGVSVRTDLRDWAIAVIEFADEIETFLKTAWPKRIHDEDDQKGFDLFMDNWKKRRADAALIYADGNHI